MKRSILSVLLALVLILLAGCGGNSATATTLVTTPAPTPEASAEYHSDEFGFSIDIPDEYEDVVGMEIQRNPDPDENVGAIVMPNEFVSDRTFSRFFVSSKISFSSFCCSELRASQKRSRPLP